jgi:hypothetical protein
MPSKLIPTSEIAALVQANLNAVAEELFDNGEIGSKVVFRVTDDAQLYNRYTTAEFKLGDDQEFTPAILTRLNFEQLPDSLIGLYAEDYSVDFYGFFEQGDDLKRILDAYTYVENTAKRYTTETYTEWDDGEVLPTSQPATPAYGDRWFDELTNKLYTFTTSWNAGVVIATSKPSSPTPGTQWFDEADNILYTYATKSWLIQKQTRNADYSGEIDPQDGSNRSRVLGTFTFSWSFMDGGVHSSKVEVRIDGYRVPVTSWAFNKEKGIKPANRPNSRAIKSIPDSASFSITMVMPYLQSNPKVVAVLNDILADDGSSQKYTISRSDGTISKTYVVYLNTGRESFDNNSQVQVEATFQAADENFF